MSVLTQNVATGAWTDFSNRGRYLSVCWNTQPGHLLPTVSWLKVNASVLDTILSALTASSKIPMTVSCDAVVSFFVFGFVNNLVWLTACLLYSWNWKHSPVFPPLCASIDVCGNFFPQICGHLAVMWWWRVTNARLRFFVFVPPQHPLKGRKWRQVAAVCGSVRLCGSPVLLPEPLICRTIKRSLECCLISRCCYKFMDVAQERRCSSSSSHLFRLNIE